MFVSLLILFGDAVTLLDLAFVLLAKSATTPFFATAVHVPSASASPSIVAAGDFALVWGLLHLHLGITEGDLVGVGSVLGLIGVHLWWATHHWLHAWLSHHGLPGRHHLRLAWLSHHPWLLHARLHHRLLHARLHHRPVSYTHLTLPTICSV